MKIVKKSCGIVDGNEVLLFTLENDKGTSVSITNIGATITSIRTVDKQGNQGETVLGFDDPKTYLDTQYLADGFYFGATVGRYANRIKAGRFAIDSKTYELEVNNGPNHLHGGINAFNTKFWNAETFESTDSVGVKMSRISPHLENGYPGELSVNVVFTLTNNNELTLNYHAKTDRKTILNLTNHSYFNLHGNGDIFDTRVLMQADKYTPKDDTNIPTGELNSVKGTPLDFTIEHSIGERVNMFDDGYDHNYVINGIQGQLRLAAQAYDPQSGRTLEFSTTEPGFQFYTAHYLNGRWSRGSHVFNAYNGFCFEAQHFPDSPNNQSFPTTLLKPGETYTQTTVYKFGTK